MTLNHAFTVFSNVAARAAGSAITFALSCLSIAMWGATGPAFGFSDTWQLIINTSTTIITFLMVFLIQNTQNRDGAAVQAKLDELIRASKASNQFIGIEHLTQEEVEEFRKLCEAKARAASEKALVRANARARKAADEASI